MGRISEETEQAIVDAYADNVPVNRICAETGVSMPGLYAVLARYGVELVRPRCARPVDWPSGEVLAQIRERRLAGASQPELRVEFGVGARLMRRALKEIGLDGHRPVERPAPVAPRPVDELVERAEGGVLGADERARLLELMKKRRR